jgi:hypothetical protein
MTEIKNHDFDILLKEEYNELSKGGMSSLFIPLGEELPPCHNLDSIWENLLKGLQLVIDFNNYWWPEGNSYTCLSNSFFRYDRSYSFASPCYSNVINIILRPEEKFDVTVSAAVKGTERILKIKSSDVPMFQFFLNKVVDPDLFTKKSIYNNLLA